MTDDEVIFADDLGWFSTVREALLTRWVAQARYVARDGRPLPIACRLAEDATAPANGHLSIPCSLGHEADEIEAFLGDARHDADPLRFLRFYLFLIGEFANQIKATYESLEWDAPSPPKSVRLWTNKYAKHRMDLLVQHHPKYFFEDNPHSAPYRSKLVAHPDVLIVDPARLPEKRSQANLRKYCVVIVPPLRTFWDRVIDYYTDFIRCAQGRAGDLSAFHSLNHNAEMRGLVELLRNTEP